MEVDENTKWKTEYNGKLYFFCGPMCKLEFDEKPEKYVQTKVSTN
jgi:YHS domain-containing protein